ncbi:MAG: DUF805 domain-containing protein [Ottowia sp.]|nr:DUF805 domain-containing protein [Ottowia sp.]
MDTPPATPGNGQLRATYAAPPVELFDAIRICLKEKYATFSGRASRSEFWFFQLFLFLLTVVAQIILTIFFFLHFASAAASARDANDAAFAMVDPMFEGTRFFIAFGIAALVMLALALPEMAVTARRLHDTGRSGWWLLLPVVPYLGFFAFTMWGWAGAPGRSAATPEAGIPGYFIFAFVLQMAFFLSGIVLLIFCCLKGQDHPNRFDH